LGFEIQELPDIIRVVVLLNLNKGQTLNKSLLKTQIDKVCMGYACVDMSDVNKTLEDMASDGLINYDNDSVRLTEQGIKLGKEWQSLLLKKEPILETVAGLVDGSITSLVIIVSAFAARLSARAAAFAALLTLTAVAITNFSSFLLGGITEDLADMLTLQTLMNYSLSDITDHEQRNKSLMLVKQLFTVLHKEISRSNIIAALICGSTTFVAGVIPTLAYLTLPKPFNIILSLGIVVTVVGVFLVRYRSRRTKVHWKVTLFQTAAIVIIATVASLIIGSVT
jgi:VIT1/CCC1 family predicted Fe2+/Mn2+ transporter